MEAEHASKEDGRELLHAAVEFLRCAVEVATDGSKLVLDVCQLALQLQEVLVCLQVGIGFHADLQASQSTAQGILRLNLLVQSGCPHSSRTGCGDALQHAFFVFGVPLYGVNKIGNEVVTLLQLNIDVSEGILAIVAQSYQVVVDANNP